MALDIRVRLRLTFGTRTRCSLAFGVQLLYIWISADVVLALRRLLVSVPQECLGSAWAPPRALGCRQDWCTIKFWSHA